MWYLQTKEQLLQAPPRESSLVIPWCFLSENLPVILAFQLSLSHHSAAESVCYSTETPTWLAPQKHQTFPLNEEGFTSLTVAISKAVIEVINFLLLDFDLAKVKFYRQVFLKSSPSSKHKSSNSSTEWMSALADQATQKWGRTAPYR